MLMRTPQHGVRPKRHAARDITVGNSRGQQARRHVRLSLKIEDFLQFRACFGEVRSRSLKHSDDMDIERL